MRKKATKVMARREQRKSRNKRKIKLLHSDRVEAIATLKEWKPDVQVDDSQGDPEFVRLVRTLLDSMPYDDPALFPVQVRKFYAALKRHGIKDVTKAIFAEIESSARRDLTLQSLNDWLGERLFSRMTEEQKNQYLPFNDVLISCVENRIEVCFAHLLKCVRNGKPLLHNGEPCFYSHRKPTISIDGKSKIIAFSKHCAQRVCERAAPIWRTYSGLGEAYGFLADCIYFETAKVKSNRDTNCWAPAFTFYQDCFLDRYRREVWSPPHEYFLNIIGPLPQYLDRHWYYRVGYCPVQVKGDFALAVTFLPPGYGKTPEYALVEELQIDQTVKNDLLNRARNQSYEYIRDTMDFELVKLFHNNGILQVRDLPGEIFAYPHNLKVDRLPPIRSPHCDFYMLDHEWHSELVARKNKAILP